MRRLVRLLLLSVVIVSIVYSNVSFSHTKKVYEFFTPSRVDNVDQFEQLFRQLKVAGEGDEVIVYDQGFGGSVSVMLLIMQAITESKATVTFIVTGPAYSANAFMTCAAEHVILNPGAFLMFHPMSNSAGPILEGELDWHSKNSYEYIHKACVPSILTQTEWESIIRDGREVYIYSDGSRDSGNT